MRLIDADALINKIRGIVPGSQDVDFIEKIIEGQPTAFDTEKVVEQLEEEGQKMAEAKPTKTYGKSSPSCHRYYKAISVKKAIDIVKKGGVE